MLLTEISDIPSRFEPNQATSHSLESSEEAESETLLVLNSLQILRFTNHEFHHSARENSHNMSSVTLENVFNKPEKITPRVFTLSSCIMGSVGSSGFGV